MGLCSGRAGRRTMSPWSRAKVFMNGVPASGAVARAGGWHRAKQLPCPLGYLSAAVTRGALTSPVLASRCSPAMDLAGCPHLGVLLIAWVSWAPCAGSLHRDHTGMDQKG